MANSLGSLVVRLGLNSGEYSTGLAKAQTSAQQFATNTTQSLQRVNRELEATAKTANYLKNSFSTITAALGVNELVKLVDGYSNLSARIKLVTSSQEDAARATAQVGLIANNTRQSLDAVASLFYRVSTATADLGTSQKDALRFTELVGKSLIVGGASAVSAKGAIEQLAQALGRGQLRGQEFNSIAEQATPILYALQRSLGVSTEKLREMADNGELTTTIIVGALLKAGKTIDEQFSQIPVTISGAFQVATNELQKFLGTQVQTAGESTILAKGILLVAKNIDVLASAAIGFGAAKLASTLLNAASAAKTKVVATAQEAAALSAKVAVERVALESELRRLTATQAVTAAQGLRIASELAAAQATGVNTAASKAQIAVLLANQAALKVAAANTAVQVAATNATIATGAASVGVLARAMGLLGGPIGVVTTVLGLGVAAWQLWGSTANAEADKAAASTERSTKDIIKSVNEQIAKLKERNALFGVPASGRLDPVSSELQEKIIRLRLDNVKLKTALSEVDDPKIGPLVAPNLGIEGFTPEGVGLIDPFKESSLSAAEMRKQIERNNEELLELTATTKEFAEIKASDDFDKRLGLRDEVKKKFESDLQQMNREIAETKEKLGDLFTPDIEAMIRAKHAKKGRGGVDDPSKKIAEGQIRALEAILARERDILQAREAFLRDSFAEGLVSVNQYYDGLQEARDKNLQAAIQALDTEAAVQENLLKSRDKNVDKQAALNKIDDIKERQVNLTRDARSAEEQLARDRRRSSQEYLDELSEINAKLLEINGNTAAAAQLRLAAQNRIQRNRLAATGDTDALAKLDEIDKQIIVQNRLNDSTKEYGILLGYLDLAQESINIARETGAITELEAQFRSQEAIEARIPQLKRVAELYAEIARQSKDPADILKAQQIQVALERLEAQLDQVANRFRDIFVNSFADGLNSLITGTKSFKEAFKDMEKQIVAGISRIATQNIAEALFGKNGAGGGVGDFFAKIFGGKPGEALGGIGKSLGNLFGAGGGKDVPKDEAGFEALIAKFTGATAEDLAASTAITSAATTLTLSGAELNIAGISLTTAGAALTSAAAALAAGGAGGGLGSLFGNLGQSGGFGGGEILTGLQFAARGSNFTRGGMYMVGEEGPEIVHLPVGARVKPNDEVRSGLGSSNVTIVQHIGQVTNTQTARQAAKMAGDRASMSMRRG